MDFGHQDVAAVDLFLGRVPQLRHVTVGDGAEQHVVFTGLLLDGETTDGVEGDLEVEGFVDGLTLGFLGAAVFTCSSPRVT